MDWVLAIAIPLLVLVVASLVVQIVWIGRAPYGWQDETGFHLGRQPAPDVRKPRRPKARKLTR